MYLGVRPLFPRARLLSAVAAGPEQHGAHAEELRGDDVVVDAVADHDAFDGVDAKVIAGAEKQAHVGFAQAVYSGHLAVTEVAPNSMGVKLRDDAVLLVGGQAQPQAVSIEAVKQVRDAFAQLEYLTLVGAGRERLPDPPREV